MNTKKQELRLALTQKIENESKNNLGQISQKICQHILNMPEYKRAKNVFCFVSTQNEINTNAILQNALSQNKILCVPLCAQKGVMVAKQITSLGQLSKGKYNISEPPKNAKTIEPNSIDFAIVPCLATGQNGARIGYGGGYYDRYLPQLLKTTTTVALCRNENILKSEEIIIEPHDVFVKWVVSEKGAIKCQLQKIDWGKE